MSVSNSFAILSPPVITSVMQQTQDVLTLPMPLLWYERAAKPNVTGREMTLKERTDIYASDIIAMDATAHVREAGQFSFQQHGSNKLKQGVWFSEEMLSLIGQLSEGNLGDTGYFALQSYLGRWARALELGRQQRAEAMLNAMMADELNYNRLGIIINATFGMQADLKFSAASAWRDTAGVAQAAATPITDLVQAMFYARRHYGEGHNRITMSFSAFSAIPTSTEFINTYKSQAFQFSPASPGPVEAQNANPSYYVQFLANFVSAAMATTSGQTRPVTIEIYDGQYRDYDATGAVGTPVPFHSADNNIVFTNSADDGQSSGWDLGNGPCVEGQMQQILSAMGAPAILGSFQGVSPWGPVGYVCPANVNMNPPNLQMWNVGWVAPRKHRDTCSARLKAWPDA